MSIWPTNAVVSWEFNGNIMGYVPNTWHMGASVKGIHHHFMILYDRFIGKMDMNMVKKLIITISSNKPLCEFESWDPANHWWFRVTGLLGSLCRVHYINCSQRPQILVILVSTQLMFWYCIFSMIREIRFGKDCHLSRCTHKHVPRTVLILLSEARPE